MKQLNVTFEGEDFDFIEDLKKDSGLNWRDFLMLLVTHAKDSIKKGNLKFEKKKR